MEGMEEEHARETLGDGPPLRVGQIARLLGVTPKTIYAEIACGALPALAIGGTYRVERAEYAAYLGRCRAKARREAAAS